MTDFAQMIRYHVRDMSAYQPIVPFDVLSEQLGLPVEAIIKLDANENPYGPLPAAQEALAGLSQTHIYPDPESRHLRRALADYHGVPVENLLAGAGADELIDLLMRLLLEPGDAIIDCPPTFGMYAFDAGVNAARVIRILRNPDFSLDLEAVQATVKRHRPKLLFLASPNNPDGGILSRQELMRLLELPVIVIVDEAYVDFGPEKVSVIQDVTNLNNLVVLRTFSKWAGLAGLRVGYGAFPKWMVPFLWKIKQPYNVSVAASIAAMASLKGADALNVRATRIVLERERLYKALKGIAWLDPYPSQANFVLCRVIDRPAVQVKEEIAKSGILIRYFDYPGLEEHIRISVGTPEQTDALLAALINLE